MTSFFFVEDRGWKIDNRKENLSIVDPPFSILNLPTRARASRSLRLTSCQPSQLLDAVISGRMRRQKPTSTTARGSTYPSQRVNQYVF
jgi:hypothetical protein